MTPAIHRVIPCRLGFREILCLSTLFLILIISVIEIGVISRKSKLWEERTITSVLLNDISCDALFQRDWNEPRKAKKLKITTNDILDAILFSTNSCDAIERLFRFFPTLSDEERNFPVAYAMLMNRDATQVMMLVSAIYQPQNQFCIAVDGKSDEKIWNAMRELAKCYPNIHIFRAKEIRWCSFEIIESIFECVVYLSKSKARWKYMQIISDVDAPLKTNLETVRILKAMNGSFNTEILPFERYRLNRKRLKNSPLPPIKSSMVAIFSRESADFMANSKMIYKQLKFLNGTICADESLWGTIAGNINEFSMPGGFDANKFLLETFGRSYSVGNVRFLPGAGPIDLANKNIAKGEFVIDHYVIPRYQQWLQRDNARCEGRYYRQSCVFGVDDLPTLVKRHELVAHKMYLDFQPAAFLCLVQEGRRRSLHPVEFKALGYDDLPNGLK